MSLDIEKAAELAREAWTDYLIEEGKPVSDYQPEPFSVRFMTDRKLRLDHMPDAIVDHGDSWYDDLFVQYANALTARSTARTYSAMGKHSEACQQWRLANEADANIGQMIRIGIQFYISDMEAKENA